MFSSQTTKRMVRSGRQSVSPLPGPLAVINACLQRTRQRFQGLKETLFDFESGNKFLIIASLWFVHQAAAYPFLKLCSQLPWDCLSCDVIGGHLSGDEFRRASRSTTGPTVQLSTQEAVVGRALLLYVHFHSS